MTTIAWVAVAVAVYSVCVLVLVAFVSGASRPLARLTSCPDRDLARSA